jgi:ankyrin repeat protein
MNLALRSLGLGVMLSFVAAAKAATPASALADAIESGAHTQVTALIAQGADVNATQADGMTALHWALQRHDQSTTAALIAAGADVNAATRYGVTPLAIACTQGDEANVQWLLERGAEIDRRQRGGETPLMIAARTGRLAAVDALLDRGAEINARDRSGQTALMWAAAEGHAPVVRRLLDAGADFGTPLKSGFTALLFAVREGHMDVVKTLLAAGADAGGSADRRGVSPLTVAVENGHFELATVLLDAGADANDMRGGMSALHMIAGVRKPDSGDENGQPAPDGSGNLSSLDMVRELVAHGADVNARLRRGDSGPAKLSRKGATPFLLAADRADMPLMRLLLELGADPTLPNAEGSTPLMAAAGLGTYAPGEEAGTEDEALEAVELVHSLGGNVNAVDKIGETAMHGAAYASWPRMIAWLESHGADPTAWNHKNKHGWTPLIIAQGHRPGNFKPSQETVEALERILPEGAANDGEPPASVSEY